MGSVTEADLGRMTTRRLFVAGIACLAACLPAGAAQARPFQTGFLDDASFYNEPPGVASVWLGRAAAAGATLARINVYWSTVAPRQPAPAFEPTDPSDPGYSWSRVDATVRNAVANGLTPILTVLHAPSWAEGSGRAPSAPAGSWRPDPGELAAFARALALRYSGGFPDPDDPSTVLPRVARFQAWNEPNLFYYLNPQFTRGRPSSPGIYRSLLNSFYRAVKAVQPSATVLSAGLAPIGRENETVAPLRFMRILTCMGGRRPYRPTCRHRIEADVWSTHPYTTGGPTHEAWDRDDVSLGDLPDMAELLDAADRHNHIRGKHRRTPFWVSEFSWDTSPPDPGGVPMPLAKRWVAEALYRMWSAGVSAVTWLTIRDGPNPGQGTSWGETYQSGFYRFGGRPTAARPKASLQAFHFPFVAFLEGQGVQVWGRTPTSRPGPVLIQARSNGGWRAVATVRAARSGVFNRFVRTPLSPRGALRAWFGPDVSLPFSLRLVRDRYVRPFGG